VEGVGLQGLALVLLRHAVEGARAGDVHDDREDHDAEGPGVGVDGGLLRGEEAVDGLPDDPDARDEEQEGLEEGREVFDLAVAVGMAQVGGAAREPHGEEGHDGGGEVQPGVGRLGEDPEAAREEADRQLGAGEDDGRQHGAEGDDVLLVLGLRRAGVGHRAGGVVHGGVPRGLAGRGPSVRTGAESTGSKP
jgi:hypothetical protein